MATVDTDAESIQRLYDEGVYLQAHAAAKECGLFDAPSLEARVLSSRLLANLGAPRRAAALTLRTLRAFPQQPLARYFALRTILNRRGPWSAWQAWNEFGEPKDCGEILASDWWSVRGVIAAMLRDFETADRSLDKAEAASPTNPWILVERAEVLSLEDRYEEALDAARRSLTIRPFYRPGIQATAHFLEQLNRVDEAIALLTEAGAKLESGDILYQLAGLLIDCRRHAEARAILARVPHYWPLSEKPYVEGLAARNSQCAYLCGDEAAAIEQAKLAKNKFHDAVAEHLAAATPDDRRVVLDVPYVRQHFATCAPATLSALSGYWKRPADHLEVAEKICYDGTPSQSERGWAEQNGFVAREFAVDLPTTKALIDRGVPFTFTTVEPTNSHLQAVIGYDGRTRTLLVRDSNYRGIGELMSEKGLEHYVPTGPRGMVLVPQEEASRLDGLALPDAELYDQFYELLRGLDRYDRAAAAAAHDRLRAAAPVHRLTLMGRRALASFDGDLTSGRHACEQLTHQFPKCDVYLYWHWFYLRRLAPRVERLEFLQNILARHDSDPVFRLHLAEELSDDAHTHAEAERLLRRLTWTRPGEARVYYLLGNLLWSERRNDEAVQAYFVAACLSDKDEEFARAYFVAARRGKRVEEALDFLRARYRRFGGKSGFPARTLFMCYGALDRMDEAFALLDDALKRRPDDGLLLLFAADAAARSGRFAQAEDYWRRSEGKANPTERLRYAADIASYRGDLARSLKCWREILELEPQASDAAASVTRLLTEIEGRERARDFLLGLIDRFPHNSELLQLAAEFLREDDAPEAERLVRRMIEFNPVDAWARRELAIDLVLQEKRTEALVELETAEALDPSSVFVYTIRGRVYEALTRVAEARAAYRKAVEISIDCEPGIDGLMRLATTHAERTAALEFLHGQLVKQIVYGDGLTLYAVYARRSLDADRVLAQLRAALEARPDLWNAWSALVGQYVEMDRIEEAQELARRETERFSLIPGSWVDLASVCRARGDDAGEIAALEKALELSPLWQVPLRNLCQALERCGQFERIQTFVEQALRRTPTDPVLWGHLADLHWRFDRKSEAVAALERAVQLDPAYDWAWSRLREFGRSMNDPDRAAKAARELARKFPNQARSWLVVARVVEGAEHLPERLAAVDRAIQLVPMITEAYVLRSRLLCESGDFAGAKAACRPAAFGDVPPGDLGVQLAEVFDAEQDREGALQQLEKTLEHHPDYWAGWTRLAEWTEGIETLKDKNRQAAEAMIRLAPQNAFSWRCLAEARRAAEDLKGAAEAFQRALTIDPYYEYCANSLFDLAFEADDLAEAERWLNHALARDASAYAIAREAQLCTRRNQKDEALAALRRAAILSAPTSWPVTGPMQMMIKAGWKQAVEQTLRSLLDDEAAQPVVFGAWVDAAFECRKFDQCVPVLTKHRDRYDHWRDGVVALLYQLGEREWAVRAKPFLKAERERLRADDKLWQLAGYAICSKGHHAEVVAWMDDWRERTVESWMSLNLGISYAMVDRFDDAIEAHRAGAAAPPEHLTQYHYLHAAACLGIVGRWNEAAEAASRVDSARLEGDERIEERIIDEIVEAFLDNVPQNGRRLSWWQAFRADRKIRARYRKHRQKIDEVERIKKYERALRYRFAAEQGRKLFAWFLQFES